MGHKNEYGCLMAQVCQTDKEKLSRFNKKLISDDILYIHPEDNYGREMDPHLTIKYGFFPDLKVDEVESILSGAKKFTITSKKISLFHSANYDVVKFDIDLTDEISKFRERADKFPNEDTFPNYHPHMTLAYIKPKSFIINHDFKSPCNFTIDRFVYSSMKNAKTNFSLS